MKDELEIFDKVIVVNPCKMSDNKIGEIGYIVDIVHNQRLLGFDGERTIYRFSFRKHLPEFHEKRYEDVSAFKLIEKHK